MVSFFFDYTKNKLSVSVVRSVPCAWQTGNVCDSYGCLSGDPRRAGLHVIGASFCGSEGDLVVYSNWLVSDGCAKNHTPAEITTQKISAVIIAPFKPLRIRSCRGRRQQL